MGRCVRFACGGQWGRVTWHATNQIDVAIFGSLYVEMCEIGGGEVVVCMLFVASVGVVPVCAYEKAANKHRFWKEKNDGKKGDQTKRRVGKHSRNKKTSKGIAVSIPLQLDGPHQCFRAVDGDDSAFAVI